MAQQWYILYNGQQVGPMSKEQLISYGLTPNSQVWATGMANWVPVYTLPELMSLINPVNNGVPGGPAGGPQGFTGATGGPVPPLNPGANGAGNYAAPKDKTTAGLLALLLGGIGIQYFYLNKPVAGILSIVISIVTCGVWSIIPFIQGIMMLTMSQQDFDRKFVYTNSAFPIF